MNRITNRQIHRDPACGETEADMSRPRRRPGRSPRHFKAARWTPAWLGLALLAAAVAVTGCGGGDAEEEPPAAERAAEAPAGMPGQPSAAPKAKPEEEPKPEEKPLPEDISEWQKDDYYRARREKAPGLIDAVAYLGEHFAGADQADSAAQLLTNLLKKSEEPEPKSGAKKQPSPPGMGGAMGPGMEAGMGPGMEAGMDPGAMPGMEAGMEPGMEAGMMPGMEAGMPGMMGPGSASGTQNADSELIRAVVEALGVNSSGTALETLTQVVEGKFETDDNRTATRATLETLVAHLSPEYENLLFRCLTAPEKLRPLGKPGQSGQPGQLGRPPASGAYGMGAVHGMPGGGSGTGPLTAEELQRNAFALIAPVASEQFRVRLANHLASPASPQEDHDLFGDFLRAFHPDNIAAQMALLAGADMDAKTKALVQENFLACSSDALASILGVPLKHRVGEARPSSSRRRPGTGPGGMAPGMDPGGMMPGMEPGMDPGGMMPGMEPGMDPGMAPGGQAPRAGATGRPSRYGNQQPAGAPGQPGARREEALKPPDPDLPYRLAKLLWGANLTKVLQARLSQADSLESNAQAVLLASTVPVDSMRSALHQLLEKRWEDGPQSLESAGLLDEVVSDPGLLALVKMLPRKAPEQEADAPRMRPGRRQPGGQRPIGAEAQPGAEIMAPGAEMVQPGAMAPGGMPGGMGQGARRPKRSPKGPGEAWMFTSEDLVRVLCERFLAAAKAGAGTQAPAGEPGTYGLPFEVRGDANVVAEYHLDWPGGAQAKLSGVPLGALKVHYLRTEQEAKLSTLRSYYNRKIDSLETRSIPDGTWMDSLHDAPEAGWKRSIDLLFTTMVPAEEREEKKDIPITLDILCIDIKDPSAG